MDKILSDRDFRIFVESQSRDFIDGHIDKDVLSLVVAEISSWEKLHEEQKDMILSALADIKRRG